MTARQETAFELDPLTRTRLHLAGQIAAGMCANKENMIPGNWKANIARDSLDVADKLIRLAVSGAL
jgi:hypothetical protein